MMLTRFVLAVPLIAALFGCDYRDDDDHHWSDHHGDPSTAEIASAGIDVDATLADVEAGRGTGAFIEYQSGGVWHVFTSCDTEISEQPCVWDIFVKPLEGRVQGVEMEGLEDEDSAGLDDSAAHLIAVTDFDVDGMFLTAADGAAVRIDVFLDGRSGQQFVYWVEDGGVHGGAPTNPMDLLPGGAE